MRKRIVCFGDSNTWGYDALTGGRFDDEVRWPGVLARELGSGYTVIEEGLCGRTTVFEDPLNEGLCGLNYLYPCLMTHSPVDWLIIMLGTNDCKERFGLTPKNIAAGLKRLVIKAQQTPAWRDAPHILIVAPGPIEKACETSPVGGEMGRCSDRSAGLATEFEACAKLLGCSFYNAAEVVTMNRVDYMHLDQESHRRLGLRLRDMVLNKVDELA